MRSVGPGDVVCMQYTKVSQCFANSSRDHECVTKCRWVLVAFGVAQGSVWFSALGFGDECKFRNSLNFSYVQLTIPVQVFREQRCIFI